MMINLDIRYLSRRHALAASKTEGGTLTLFVPTSVAVMQGSHLELKISFEDAERSFQVFGLALTATQSMGRDGQGGCLVGFLGPNKRVAAEMLAYLAQRPASLGTALRERLTMRRGCKVILENQTYKGLLLDMSQSGAFVASGLAVARPGTTVKLKLGAGFLGMGGIWVEARVIWKGRKGEEPGFGLRFTGNEARQSSFIQKMLEQAMR